MSAWVLTMILRLVAIEGPAPWSDNYAVLAEDIASTDATVEEMALLVAIAWRESRFSPESRNTFQLSAYWGPRCAQTALGVVRHGMAFYACGGSPPFGAACHRIAFDRRWIARSLLQSDPPPWRQFTGGRLVP